MVTVGRCTEGLDAPSANVNMRGLILARKQRADIAEVNNTHLEALPEGVGVL